MMAEKVTALIQGYAHLLGHQAAYDKASGALSFEGVKRTVLIQIKAIWISHMAAENSLK